MEPSENPNVANEIKIFREEIKLCRDEIKLSSVRSQVQALAVIVAGRATVCVISGESEEETQTGQFESFIVTTSDAYREECNPIHGIFNVESPPWTEKCLHIDDLTVSEIKKVSVHPTVKFFGNTEMESLTALKQALEKQVIPKRRWIVKGPSVELAHDSIDPK